MKKVLVILIDALASRIVRPAVEQGRLPRLAELIGAGEVDWESISIFPSITPAATTSLITGCYPRQHGVAGAAWYDLDSEAWRYYGDDFWVLFRKGFDAFFTEFLLELNRDQIRSETLFQTVERAGMTAACLNFIAFRGDHRHQVDKPLLFRLWPGVSLPDEVFGPTILCLGDLTPSGVETPSGRRLRLQGDAGMLRRFGFEDDTTGRLLVEMAQAQSLPELTVAYFPENDFASHSQGPLGALPTLENVDRHLGELFQAFGGAAGLLREFAVLVTGDHSQCDLDEDEARRAIDLEDILSDFRLVRAGESWKADEQLLACPNMRACQFYLSPSQADRREELTSRLLENDRVDQVIWEQSDGGSLAWSVATRDRGRLRFWRGEEGDDSACDLHGGAWSWRGDLATVDGRLTNGRLTFGDYPNAFERIAMSYHERMTGDVWATARPGCEFRMSGVGVHPKGSHGSLHALDSTSPMILAGAPAGVRLPAPCRSVDLAPLCRAILGLSEAPQTGDPSHPTA